MIAWALLAVGASLPTLAFGAYAMRRRRASQSSEAETLRLVAGLRAQRDAADTRAKDALAECDRVRAMSLAPQRLGGESVFTGRPSPRDAEELTRLARGLTLVDDVVIADASGLSLSRETDAESSDLAPLAPTAFALVEGFRRAGLAAAEISLETFTAVRLAARPLAGRGAGTVVVVRTTSLPVNPLVLDAVALAAAGEAPVSGRPALAVSSTAPTTDRHDLGSGLPAAAMAPLDRALGGEHRAFVLLDAGRPVLSAANLGPNEVTRSAIARCLAATAARAARALRVATLARIEVTVDGGSTVAWSSFGMRTSYALVTFTDAGLASPSKLDRLVGSVRRALDTATPSSPLEGAA